MTTFINKLRRTPLRSLDIFIRSNFVWNSLEGETAFSKTQTLKAKWKLLGTAEKDWYNEAADAENEEEAKHDDQDFVAFLERHPQTVENKKKESRDDTNRRGFVRSSARLTRW